MPRTTTLECPGCPPLRALTFDSLGLIKVIEARGEHGGVPKVVERWGDPHSSKCVLAASIDDSQNDPLLAVARKNGLTIFYLLMGISSSDFKAVLGAQLKNDRYWLVLHLFNKTERRVIIQSFTGIRKNGGYLLTQEARPSDVSQSPLRTALVYLPLPWFTSAHLLSIDDHRKFVAGTNDHQVRLYDTSAQRRPVMSFDFRETPIKAVAEEPDSFNIYIGNGSGDLASVDIRTGMCTSMNTLEIYGSASMILIPASTWLGVDIRGEFQISVKGKLLGCFIGKCSGSIRSIARHPTLPIIASCGLDSYLRFWDIKTRQLLSAVFLKQHLNEVVFDSAFADKEVANAAADAPMLEIQNGNDTQEDATETLPVKRKEAPEEKDRSKKKKSKENEESKKLKSKKKRRAKGDIHDDAS
ncbi:hypothetical protein CUMW_131150 [Citrus unshiu]|uniref:Uncharacterized protein n=1 Tax=Citrus unshiu TaxID=55188 RepID=A0A2H5PFA4_CITUN|nr:hypothetical protein CUMW_131150 [Citrus unshiu]